MVLTIIRLLFTTPAFPKPLTAPVGFLASSLAHWSMGCPREICLRHRSAYPTPLLNSPKTPLFLQESQTLSFLYKVF